MEVYPTNYQIDGKAIRMKFENIKPDFDIKIILPRFLYSGLSESSELNNNKYNYSVSNVINDDPNTAWVPADKTEALIFHKDGIDENMKLFIGYYFDKLNFFGSVLVDKIGIINGLAANSNLFNENNRVKKIKISYANSIWSENNESITSKEISEIYDLKDTMAMQYIEFKKPILASYIKFTILDIYRGTKYPHDTCISKIRVITEKTNDIVDYPLP
jgi:hypothetical protein